MRVNQHAQYLGRVIMLLSLMGDPMLCAPKISKAPLEDGAQAAPISCPSTTCMHCKDRLMSRRLAHRCPELRSIQQHIYAESMVSNNLPSKLMLPFAESMLRRCPSYDGNRAYAAGPQYHRRHGPEGKEMDQRQESNGTGTG